MNDSNYARKEAIGDLARRLMDLYNLKDWKFVFTETKRRIGCCDYRKKQICFSKLFIDNEPDKIKNVILHEIAHALAGSRARHGVEWQRWAIKVGAEASSTTSMETNAKRYYEVYCTNNCFNPVKRYRKPKLSNRCCSFCKETPKYRLIDKVKNI